VGTRQKEVFRIFYYRLSRNAQRSTAYDALDNLNTVLENELFHVVGELIKWRVPSVLPSHPKLLVSACDWYFYMQS